MANNEIKTNAEIYREQRKERLAKAAKKKKSGKADKVMRILTKVICIVLLVGIVLYGSAKVLTEVFCVPQKVLTAATLGDEKLTVAEYNYYYNVLYNQACNTSQQYDQQYSGYGSTYFNTTVDPAEQDYPGDDAPEGVKTWADYFKHSAPERGFLVKKLYKEAMSEEAKKAGFELTEETKKEMQTSIDDAVKELADKAKKSDYALDNFIAKACGEGLNEKLYRELLERDSIAQYYIEWYQKNAQESITDKDVDAYYAKHRDEIDIASFRYFTVSYAEATEDSKDPVYTKAEAKTRAEAFKAEATTEADFIAAAKKYAPPSYASSYADDAATLAENLTKSNLEGISEKFADWTFDASRKAGQMGIFDAEEQEAFYIVLMTVPAHKDTATAGADVRHLLVEAKTSKENAEGESVTLSNEEIEANFAKAKTEADKLLKQWKDGEATEDSFIKLVNEHTDDPGSKETGGLYEDITSTSQYVPEFLDWALAKHKVGDTGIIKTDYGYHIMYFKGADSQQKWQSDIRAALGSEDYNAYFDEVYENVSKEIKRSEIIIDFFADRLEETIAKNVKNAVANSQLY